MIKRYNENIDWEFDYEETYKIHDGMFYLFLFPYNDSYSININDKYFIFYIYLLLIF